MTTVRAFLVAIMAFAFTTCGGQKTCGTLTHTKAEAMAVREKAGKLSRSPAGYAANFESNEVADVRTNVEGYAAKVAFKGKDDWTLVALVKDNCNVTWTEIAPRPTP
jgi:hypothetical protein